LSCFDRLRVVQGSFSIFWTSANAINETKQIVLADGLQYWACIVNILPNRFGSTFQAFSLAFTRLRNFANVHLVAFAASPTRVVKALGRAPATRITIFDVLCYVFR